MTKTTTITATLIVALSAALISGCTPTAPEAIAPTAPAPTVSSTVEPTAEPTEAPAEVVVGGTVDADTAREINRDFKSTTKAYQLSDGSYVVIDREQPLPEPVKAEVGGEANAVIGGAAGDPIASQSNTVILGAQQATGRKIIAVVQVTIYCDSASVAKVTTWTTLTATAVSGCLGSKESAIAYAQKFVSEQDHPTNWDIAIG